MMIQKDSLKYSIQSHKVQGCFRKKVPKIHYTYISTLISKEGNFSLIVEKVFLAIRPSTFSLLKKEKGYPSPKSLRDAPLA